MYVQNKHENAFVSNKPTQRVVNLLAESEKAIRAGNSRYAYELSMQATQLAPNNVEAWLLRATLAPSVEERLMCVNRLNELAPGYQDRYNIAYFALKDALDKDPFLAYLEETEELYRVLNANRVVLSIPKKRAPVNVSPSEQTHSGPLKIAYRWLTLSLIGLLLAGIGTVIFAPLAALAAIRVQQSVQTRSERVSATIVLMVAFGLFMVGMVFSLLFILHWLG